MASFEAIALSDPPGRVVIGLAHIDAMSSIDVTSLSNKYLDVKSSIDVKSSTDFKSN